MHCKGCIEKEGVSEHIVEINLHSELKLDSLIRYQHIRHTDPLNFKVCMLYQLGVQIVSFKCLVTLDELVF